ncbi:hypothetical protein AMS66_13660 [Paenibacillus xylanivorans]|uniref:Uncharacterized protein n=1 Tax=Paenibacillus xylanivorans TaxID=1705561 RepID=A0A0N1IWN8_9BACL|nr:hypothetical protein AMS66_13660 [Paenibacillus xylanivorans]
MVQKLPFEEIGNINGPLQILQRKQYKNNSSHFSFHLTFTLYPFLYALILIKKLEKSFRHRHHTLNL